MSLYYKQVYNYILIKINNAIYIIGVFKNITNLWLRSRWMIEVRVRKEALLISMMESHFNSRMSTSSSINPLYRIR